MAVFPPAVIFVNKDLTDSVENMLINQLSIDITMDGYVFDTDPAGFSAMTKTQDKRIMVVRSLAERDNRNFADVVIFAKAGLAAILCNKFGPPGGTYPIVNLNWKQLGFSGDNHSLM